MCIYICFSVTSREMSAGANSRTGTGMFGEQTDEKNRKTRSWDTCQANELRETS